MALSIKHNPAASRFEYIENDLLCRLDYELNNNVMAVTHTVVSQELGGRGIAGELTEAAFAMAKENNWKINPICSYTATYFKRHPEHLELQV